MITHDCFKIPIEFPTGTWMSLTGTYWLQHPKLHIMHGPQKAITNGLMGLWSILITCYLTKDNLILATWIVFVSKFEQTSPAMLNSVASNVWLIWFIGALTNVNICTPSEFLTISLLSWRSCVFTCSITTLSAESILKLFDIHIYGLILLALRFVV